jgi:mono/diheme cytochrome c family protein
MRLALLAATLLASPAIAAAQGATPVAAAPDTATIRQGREIFEGRGLCASCHGRNGEGVLGPSTRLNAGKVKWLHNDGTLTGLIAVINAGVSEDQSEVGTPMPPRGGARLTDEQVNQVAAYVLQLHRQPLPK